MALLIPNESYHCLLLDVRLTGLSGGARQQQLLNKATCRPFVVMTGYGRIPTSVKAVQNGAVDYLIKPIEEKIQRS
ncbi:MAG: FixJ family two-component response regulator [Candidatus Krumholzibacteriia bacterium]